MESHLGVAVARLSDVSLELGTRGSVRRALPHEGSDVLEVIASAFESDPAARWMYPDIDQYRTHFEEFARWFGGAAFACGTAHLIGNCDGAALWLPPMAHPDERALTRLIEQTTGESLRADLFQVLEEMSRFHPVGAHWHLAMIGVRPSSQRMGLGAELLSYALRTCDDEGLPAYLESSNPENIPFYEQHGFRALGLIQVGSSPVITPMLRSPR